MSGPVYRVVSQDGPWVDSILEYDLTKGFDLDNPDVLTAIIEKSMLVLIENVEGFLSGRSKHEN